MRSFTTKADVPSISNLISNTRVEGTCVYKLEMYYQSWKSRLSERFSPEREMTIWAVDTGIVTCPSWYGIVTCPSWYGIVTCPSWYGIETCPSWYGIVTCPSWYGIVTCPSWYGIVTCPSWYGIVTCPSWYGNVICPSWHGVRPVFVKIKYKSKEVTKAIPPSKSFTIWRLFHHKMSTDDNLQKRGCQLASMCSNCYSHPEDSHHLFLSCSFALKFWDWLSSIFNFHIETSSIDSLFLGCNGRWSLQVKGVLEATIIHTINTVWFCRNVSRFENKKFYVLQAKLRIKLATSFSGNNSALLTNNSIAYRNGRKDIWLECDYVFVVDIFNGKGNIPWKLANK
ncbi:hypothetical protein Lal_00029796 [Lupinus albus]|nr:hypothetical protein Lal_00029796 [Lupinus albus]